MVTRVLNYFWLSWSSYLKCAWGGALLKEFCRLGSHYSKPGLEKRRELTRKDIFFKATTTNRSWMKPKNSKCKETGDQMQKRLTFKLQSQQGSSELSELRVFWHLFAHRSWSCWGSSLDSTSDHMLTLKNETVCFTSKIGLLWNRRGIAIQDKAATVNHRQVLLFGVWVAPCNSFHWTSIFLWTSPYFFLSQTH